MGDMAVDASLDRESAAQRFDAVVTRRGLVIGSAPMVGASRESEINQRGRNTLVFSRFRFGGL
jgi:hypothetical protein